MSVEAMKMALACLRWQCFGECRTEGWDGTVPRLGDTITVLEDALREADKEQAELQDFVAKLQELEREACEIIRNSDKWTPDDMAYRPGGVSVEQAEKQTVRYFPNDGHAHMVWVGLTDEEITDLFCDFDASQFVSFVRSIEAKLKEKNT